MIIKLKKFLRRDLVLVKMQGYNFNKEQHSVENIFL